MTVLPALDRDRIRRYFMRWNTENCAFTKADLQAAVNATDDWIDQNAAAFNTALPTAFKNNASAQQKTDLFCFVAQRRANKLKVEEDG